MIEILAQLAAGERLALILFAVMSLLSPQLEQGSPVDRLRARGVLFLAISVVLYSPAHAAWLMGKPAPPAVGRFLDVMASGLACTCFIYLLAGRAMKRGLSPLRVRRGMQVNFVVLTAIVGATWLTR